MFLLRQLLTVALVAVLGAGAVLPVLAAYRCPTMGRRFVDGCCHPSRSAADDSADASPDPEARISPRCCDLLPALALEARAGCVRTDEGCAGAYASVLALRPPPAAIVTPALVSWRHHAAKPRGRPPGELLILLGTVLRV